MGGVKASDESPEAFVVLATSPDEPGEKALRTVDRLQELLAEYHFGLYRSSHPDLTVEDWRQQLGCGDVQRCLQQGVVVLRALEVATGEAVGYLSYASRGGSAKVNHLVVLPGLRGRGIGRQLLEAFFQRLAAARAELGETRGVAWIVAAELNERAVSLYRRLGFVATRLYIDRHEGGAICYVTLGRGLSDEGDAAAGRDLSKLHLFGSEVCGEQVTLTDETGQLQFSVQRYDRDKGLHKLEGGAWINLSAGFARGEIRFGRPLHDILGAPVSYATRSGRRRLAAMGLVKQGKAMRDCAATDAPVTPPSRPKSASMTISSPSGKTLPAAVAIFDDFSNVKAISSITSEERPRARRRLKLR